MNKDIKKIIIALAFYSISGGFFYNFWELWLAENNMSLNTISIILSLCSLIAVSVIFLSSNLINPKRLKSFISTLLLIKTIILFSLFFLYKSNLNVLIKFLVLIDYGIDTEIYTCFYPLIALIKKDDKLYAVRGLVYDISYYLGVLVVSIILGFSIGNFVIGFNTYVISSAILLTISLLIMLTVKVDSYYKNSKKKEDNSGLLLMLLKGLKKDKISIFYLLFVFFASMGFYCVMGLVLSILVNEFQFAPQAASSIKLTIGISGVLIGALIMAKFTCKNNFINISIKFLGRAIVCLLAFIFPNKWVMGFAFLYILILSSSYNHVADGPYINRFDSDKQLAFANLKEMIGYLSRSIGTFLCGVCLVIGLRFNFLVTSICAFISIIFAYQALYLYNKEKRGKNGRKRLGRST